jgi:hypothetical protein
MSDEKTIEMRLAEIEDKLARLHVTEEEMRAFHKVNALLGGGGGEAQAGQAVAPQAAALSPTVCTIVPRYISRYRVINRGIAECNECGPCAQFGGGSQGGGFGGFGM